MKFEIEIPDDATIGDLITTRGALYDAAADFVDWDKLHDRVPYPDAISAPGCILMDIANQLRSRGV